MFPKRPFLYLTSGLALAFGLIWFRRKKSIHCDTGGKSSSQTTSKDSKVDQSHLNGHANSQPIDCNNEHRAMPETTKLGKSAPIDINPNRISPIQLTDKQIDADILKVKIQDTEYKKLNSIEEQEAESLSPIDLPDSFERKRMSFTFNRSICNEEPIIVKAAIGPNVSPKQFIIEDDAAKSVEESTVTDVEEPKISCEELPPAKASPPIRNPPPVSSPPLSLCSMQSNDSGKGSSPPHSEGTPAPATTYEFLLEQSLTGLLLGYKGSYVKKLKSKTGATVLIKRHPDSSSIKICAIEGTQQSIDAALAMIRQKFPEKKYPDFKLQRVYFASSVDAVIPLSSIDQSVMQLQLIEGINNDVAISTMMPNGSVFVQQPLHPTYPILNALQNCMNQTYGLCDSPMLPDMTKEDSICVGCVEGHWYRVQIIHQDPDTQTCTVKYLDYGSYTSMDMCNLRQIRSDFMTVPFQSIECTLSNVKPIGDEWSEEAISFLLGFSKGYILQAQVAGYTICGTPEVYLFACLSANNVIFINKELVARNLATWIEDSELTA